MYLSDDTAGVALNQGEQEHAVLCEHLLVE